MASMRRSGSDSEEESSSAMYLPVNLARSASVSASGGRPMARPASFALAVMVTPNSNKTSRFRFQNRRDRRPVDLRRMTPGPLAEQHRVLRGAGGLAHVQAFQTAAEGLFEDGLPFDLNARIDRQA